MNLDLQFSSKVTNCEVSKESIVEYGKTIKFEGYAITLENTILFPAGGGQVILKFGHFSKQLTN